MSPLYMFQFFLYSFCIHLFTLYTYVVYYSDLFSSKFRDELLPEYDYIIVGSGTAGSVIAHRLATETNYSFVVLEAGSRSHFLMDIPIVGPAIQRSLFDWAYETVPQEHACFAMEDLKCRLPQGKIAGGSSKLNNMIHHRGNISHYVQWFHGKYTEDYIKTHLEYIENEIVCLDSVKFESDIANAILDAAVELGFTELKDDLGLGFTKSKVSQKDGKRWSASDKVDLKFIVTNALVEKVIFKGETAVGVSVSLAGIKKNILGRKGVILSAGAYNSPKILQLSGVGPANLLKSLEISLVKDLPVGENLQEHIASGLDLVVLDKFPSLGAHDIVNPMNSLTYFLQGSGPLTTPGCEVLGFVSTKNETIPDLQFMVLPMGISSDRGSRLRKSLAIKDNIWNQYFAKTFDKYTASIIPIILHPKSKGTVFIRSGNPNDSPFIDPKYLSHEDDRQVLINGLKLVKRILETKSMNVVKARINSAHFPGCEKYVIFSNDYWQCYIKYLTLSSYHPVGTCSMGLPGKSVINTSFKIHGLSNLYIVDASVLPALPSGNINAAVAMMASIFFDSNIKSKNIHQFCSSYDQLNECLFNICISS